MPLSRRAFLQLAALSAASLVGTLKPSPLAFAPSIHPLRLLTTGRPSLDPTIAAFTAATGRAVQLLQSASAAPTGFDLAIVPAYTLTKLIYTNQVQQLGVSQPAPLQRPYDPYNTFSLPAGRGPIGINARSLQLPQTWAAFFELAASTPTHLPSAETLHAALKYFGGSLNTRNTLAHTQARTLVASLTSIPLAQAQLALGPQLPGWNFNIPASGAELWEDCYCLPTSSTQPALARTFLQFVPQPATLAPRPTPPLEPRSPFAPSF